LEKGGVLNRSKAIGDTHAPSVRQISRKVTADDKQRTVERGDSTNRIRVAYRIRNDIGGEF
jgi:hypothetical protein